ncbi:MAG: hypothetical protein ACE5FA_09700 [Dehalococcoidia bacterium]
MRIWLAWMLLTVVVTSPSRAQRGATQMGPTVGQPRSTPMGGLGFGAGAWTVMAHAVGTIGYNRDPSPRGSREALTTSMVTVRIGRRVGPGLFSATAMTSLEPIMGSRGYPLLLQTGETSDGVTPLLDRQHPHDLFMQLSARYAVEVDTTFAIFLRVAPVGPPALGPPVFMHRLSGRNLPTAPIAHHFMDATHITYGVVTLGIVRDRKVTIEGSIFNGREPDQRRWNLERPAFNSFALRVTVDPHPDWSIQASLGQLDSPEQVHPGIDVVKLTLSATYNRPLAAGNWQTTLILGRNKSEQAIIPLSQARATFPPAILAHFLAQQPPQGVPEDSLSLFFPARAQSAILVESAIQRRQTSVFARFEWARKDELFGPADVRHSRLFGVSKASLGGIVELPARAPVRIGFGAVGSVHFVAGDLQNIYGSLPASLLVFGRVRLQQERAPAR